MKEIAFDFRLARARHPATKDEIGWAMELGGTAEEVRHVIRTSVGPYPSRRQMLQVISRTTRAMTEWFHSPDFEAAKARASRPRLIVVPGGTEAEWAR